MSLPKGLYQPMEARVLVKVDEVEQKTESGIIVKTGESFKRDEMAHDVGTIVALGPVAFSHMDDDALTIGDRVMFNSYAGNKKVVDGIVYRYINDCDFFAFERCSS